MKLNILFLIPTLRRGGAETQLISLANSLNPAKFTTKILCFDQDTHQLNKLNSNIKFYHYPRKSKYDTNVIKSIANIIDDQKIDVVHCTLQIALLFGWAAQRLSHRTPKLATTIHTTVHRDFRSAFFSWLIYQWFMRACDVIVFVCHEQCKHWEKKWGFIKRKSVVIHNGIDPIFFQRSAVTDKAHNFRAEHGISNATKVIAHIAGFRPEKGHQILINAFKTTVDKVPGIILVFAGDGVLRNYFESVIKDENLENNVRFIGNVSDVRPLLANADIAVIASTAVETFSMAMLEAMSMQVPLVATDIGGTREAVIPKQTGWLVPPENVAALENALIASLTDDSLRRTFSDNARQYVVSNFTQQQMATGMESLFTKICYQ